MTRARRNVTTPQAAGWLALVVSVGPSCVAYHSPNCPEDGSEIVATTNVALDLRPTYVRTQEAPVGNLVADALYARLQPSGAQMAVINAGALRDDDGCQLIDEIPRGALRRTQIEKLLAGTGPYAVVEVTAAELRAALELGVSHLAGPDSVEPSPAFLQVSHLQFSVDCRRDAHLDGQPGGRIADLMWIDSAGTPQPVLDNAPGTGELLHYRVATSSYVAGGGDGMTALNHPVPITNLDETIAAFLDFVARAPDGHVEPAVDGRITLDGSCWARLP